MHAKSEPPSPTVSTEKAVKSVQSQLESKQNPQDQFADFKKRLNRLEPSALAKNTPSEWRALQHDLSEKGEIGKLYQALKPHEKDAELKAKLPLLSNFLKRCENLGIQVEQKVQELNGKEKPRAPLKGDQDRLGPIKYNLEKKMASVHITAVNEDVLRIKTAPEKNVMRTELQVIKEQFVSYREALAQEAFRKPYNSLDQRDKESVDAEINAQKFPATLDQINKALGLLK